MDVFTAGLEMPRRRLLEGGLDGLSDTLALLARRGSVLGRRRDRRRLGRVTCQNPGMK